MNQKSGEEPPEPPPEPTDLNGWRRALAEDRLRDFRPEAIVAAFQDLGPHTDTGVRDGLAKHLSRIIVGMLRKRVGFNRANEGKDIIFHVHGQIFEALLKPKSSDGRGLREAFGARVIFRMKTALADEKRAQIVPAPKLTSDKSKGVLTKNKNAGAEEVELVSLPKDPDRHARTSYEDDDASPDKRQIDPALMDDVHMPDEMRTALRPGFRFCFRWS